MSWAEVKKVNSDMSTPLDAYLKNMQMCQVDLKGKILQHIHTTSKTLGELAHITGDAILYSLGIYTANGGAMDIDLTIDDKNIKINSPYSCWFTMFCPQVYDRLLTQQSNYLTVMVNVNRDKTYSYTSYGYIPSFSTKPLTSQTINLSPSGLNVAEIPIPNEGLAFNDLSLVLNSVASGLNLLGIDVIYAV